MVSVPKAKTSPKYAPGPKAHFLWGVIPEFAHDPTGFISTCVREYGDIVLWKGPFFWTYLLNHPDYIEEVLVKKTNLFAKHYNLKLLQRMWGNGLLASQGEFWQRQRRLMQPAFHRDRIFSYGKIMVEYVNRLLGTWSGGEVRNIHEDMMHITLEIVAKALFGVDLVTEAEKLEVAMRVSMEYFELRNNHPLLFWTPDWIPLPYNLRYQKAVQQFDEIIYRIIQQRRVSGEDAGDLLSTLLQVEDEDHVGMSDRQIRDEIMTLSVAGHETTAIALSWVWYLLWQHPQVEQKLLEELQTVLGGRQPTFADLPQLRYTENIIMEVFRLYPPAWAIARRALEDCEIGGYTVHAGQAIVMSQWMVHRDRRYFDEPEVFNPDRWAGDLAKRLPTFAYFPFGGGSRICIGKSFAMMEAVIILATIAQKFRLTLVPDQKIEPWAAFTFRPKYGIKMLLNKR